MAESASTLAVFIDFENLALGFAGRGKSKEFEIAKVLGRLVEKGKIVVKKAYCDWSRFKTYKSEFHDAAIELIDIPKRSKSGKNSADLRLAVDAMDMCYAKTHIEMFVIVSGDSDFTPLVSKLKENGKFVIGLGMKDSTSQLLIDNSDEFIFYEDLERPMGSPPPLDSIAGKKREAFKVLLDCVNALVRENKEILWSSMVKQTIKRKVPQFNESYFGYRTFSELLEEAEERGLIQLRRDERSGSYVITGFGKS